MEKTITIQLTESQAKLLKECLISDVDQAVDYDWGQQAEDDLEDMITQLGGRGEVE
jgi:hypothetical protein